MDDENPEPSTATNLNIQIVLGRLQNMMRSPLYTYINILIIAGCMVTTFLYTIFKMSASSEIYNGIYLQYLLLFLFLTFNLFVAVFNKLSRNRLTANNEANILVFDQQVSQMNIVVPFIYICIVFSLIMFVMIDASTVIPSYSDNIQFLIFIHVVFLGPKILEIGIFATVYITLINAKIPSKNVKYDDRIRSQCEECVICRDKFEDGEMIKMLKCRHYFHGECIEEWNKVKSMCPLCKRVLLDGNSIREIIK